MKKNNCFLREWKIPELQKVLRTMKLTIFLILISVISVFANKTYSQTKMLNLNMKNCTVKEVLRNIEEQSEFYFMYSEKLVDVYRKVSIDINNSKVDEVLDKLFASTNVEYTVKDRFVLLTTPEVSGSDLTILQQNTVSVTVTDESGLPLPGVTVLIKGTTNGSVTNADGNYTITNLPENTVLEFSFVGMKSQEIVVGTQTTINISMEVDAIGLDEIVAIGYGTAKKSEVTGSVGVVTAEDLAEQPSVNPLGSLRGKIAGVTIFSNSGEPGGNPRVLIRGMGTINASTQPLYVVDGVQSDNIDYLNSTDIESIEVLKDASSAAIYGSRGANGVVIITTQRGLKKEGSVIEYKSNVSIGRLAKKGDTMYEAMNAEEFMEVQRISFENAPYFKDYAPGTEPKLILDNDRLFDSQGNPLYDTNWEEEVTRTAVSHDHQLSIRSASKKSSTGFFLNYTDQNGIYLNSYMKRANIKYVYDVDLLKWFSVGLNVKMNRIWENKPYTEGSGVSAITRMVHEFPSIFPVKWADGTWSNSSQTEGTTMAFEDAANPVSTLLDAEFLHDRTNIIGNVFADFHITPHLDFRTQFGYTNKLHKYRYYGPTYLHDMGYPEGRAGISNSNTTSWQNENFLTYNNKFGEHKINAILGASWEKFIYDGSNLSARGFDNDFFKYNRVNVSENFDHPGSDYYDWSMNSYFFRGNYTYNDKYTFTLTGRMDGSSRFGENNKYAFFPSGGISWLVSEEDFMSEMDFIDWLRLRTSYGVTGNSAIGLYNSLATISSGTTLIGGALNTISSAARLANPDLKWEKSSQVNAGMDVRAFNNVLTLELDYYYKLTTDLLLSRPIPSTTGFTSIMDNIGEVSNQGIDLLITTRNVTTSQFNWSTTLSMNYNKNQVEKLGENDEDIFPGPYWVGGSQTILRVGEPVSSFWGFVREGTWNSDEVDDAAAEGKKPGMIKRSADPQIIGKGLPDYRGGFINKFNWGNFDATIDLQFSLGSDIMQQFVTTAEDRQALMNGIKTQLYDSWTPNNQDTPIPMIRNTNLSGQDLAVDSHWIVDGSYIRGNLFAVGYTFDPVLINKIGLDHLRINASFENAFVLVSDQFKGYDPESNGQWDGSNFGQNIFFYQYPKPRTFSLGLNVRF